MKILGIGPSHEDKPFVEYEATSNFTATLQQRLH